MGQCFQVCFLLDFFQFLGRERRNGFKEMLVKWEVELEGFSCYSSSFAYFSVDGNPTVVANQKVTRQNAAIPILHWRVDQSFCPNGNGAASHFRTEGDVARVDAYRRPDFEAAIARSVFQSWR